MDRCITNQSTAHSNQSIHNGVKIFRIFIWYSTISQDKIESKQMFVLFFFSKKNLKYIELKYYSEKALIPLFKERQQSAVAGN